MIRVRELEDGVVGLRMARTLLGRGLYFTASYWVDGLLIDTGPAHTAREFLGAVAHLPIEWAVITHHHEDHNGANALLSRERGVPIFAPTGALPFLAQPRRLALKPYQRLFWGWPEPSAAEPLPTIVETTHHRFEVVPTPGHSPDHVCFYEPERGWLFTGDAYVGGRDRALRADYNVWQIVASLKRLAALPHLTRLHAGSGSVYDDPRPVLVRKIAYLEELGARVRELHAQGFNYARIRRQLLGREGFLALLTGGNFSGYHLVRSFVEDVADSPSTGTK